MKNEFIIFYSLFIFRRVESSKMVKQDRFVPPLSFTGLSVLLQ